MDEKEESVSIYSFVRCSVMIIGMLELNVTREVMRADMKPQKAICLTKMNQSYLTGHSS